MVGGRQNKIMSLLKTNRSKNYSQLKCVKNVFGNQKKQRKKKLTKKKK